MYCRNGHCVLQGWSLCTAGLVIMCSRSGHCVWEGWSLWSLRTAGLVIVYYRSCDKTKSLAFMDFFVVKASTFTFERFLRYHFSKIKTHKR